MSQVEAAVHERGGEAPAMPTDVAVRTWLGFRHGQWEAIALDYTVVGVGETPDEAVEQMVEQLVDYLEAMLAEGVWIDDARRPIPRGWRLELQALSTLSKLLGPVRRARRARAVEVPFPADLRGFVGC